MDNAMMISNVTIIVFLLVIPDGLMSKFLLGPYKMKGDENRALGSGRAKGIYKPFSPGRNVRVYFLLGLPISLFTAVALENVGKNADNKAFANGGLRTFDSNITEAKIIEDVLINAGNNITQPYKEENYIIPDNKIKAFNVKETTAGIQYKGLQSKMKKFSLLNNWPPKVADKLKDPVKDSERYKREVHILEKNVDDLEKGKESKGLEQKDNKSAQPLDESFFLSAYEKLFPEILSSLKERSRDRNSNVKEAKPRLFVRPYVFNKNLELRLNKLDYYFNNLHIYDEDCKERVLCEVSMQIQKYSPLSEVLLEEVSFSGSYQRLRPQLLSSREGVRLLTYMEAALRGRDNSRRCSVFEYRCGSSTEQLINYDALQIWKEVNKWMTVKMLSPKE